MNCGGAQQKDAKSVRAASKLLQASNPEFPNYGLQRVPGFGSDSESEEEEGEFKIGTAVEVYGLVKAVALNGCRGVVVSANDKVAAGRVAVLLDGHAKPNSIREDNVRRCA